MDKEVRINHQITAGRVRVVDSEGDQLGVMDLQEGLREAKKRNLDLVEVDPTADPPVAKLLDYDSYRYRQEKREQKKGGRPKRTKTVRLTVKIADHDLSIKEGKMEDFLEAGHRVRLVVTFQGREKKHKQRGYRLLDRVVEEIGNRTRRAEEPTDEGNQLTLLLEPEGGNG